MLKGDNHFCVSCMDGAKGLFQLQEKSVKLVYGSPPYPNAERNYGIWKSEVYIDKISPFIEGAIHALRPDGFIIINVKANREKATNKSCSERSLVIEELALEMKKTWKLYCVDIEVWVKGNPVPTGLRCACQDAYEQNLWFSVSPKWNIFLDGIRRPYEEHSKELYDTYEYKPRNNGLSYVRKNKRIQLNPLGALPTNVVTGGVSAKKQKHQAVQPGYLADKYIKATTEENDIVVDPWMGSGTTGVSALMLNRRFIGFDINENYVRGAQEVFERILGRKV